jgi:hypothetical protein
MISRFAWMMVAVQGLAACGDDTTGEGGAGGGGGDATSSATGTSTTTASAATATATGTATGAGGEATGGGDAGGGETGGGDAGGAGGGESGGAGGGEPALPEACPATPELQSPASFDPEVFEPQIAETCETEGSAWLPCHEHLHCGPEHSGAGICGDAECEVHTVHRRRKDGGATAEVEEIHEGTVGGNCQPADHDLMVRARFVSFDKQCETEGGDNLTYCGSATGNNMLDVDADGFVTCEEAGVNPTPVRWCIETACVCEPGAKPKGLGLGEDEATREQGCPGE